MRVCAWGRLVERRERGFAGALRDLVVLATVRYLSSRIAKRCRPDGSYARAVVCSCFQPPRRYPEGGGPFG